ncbi:MAG: hypothetical protein LBB84_07825 [Tannerellaceae bacterium]|jgi:hypothetical protein|nr:hypothetical protein [Tannerellaceae bacterium]
MKLELIKQAGKIAGYNFVAENPAEERAVQALGEITVVETEEEPDEYLVCSVCGSKNVLIEAWIYANGGEYAGEAGCGEARCEDCNCEVKIILKKGQKEKKIE